MGQHVMYLFIFHFLAGLLLSTATDSYMTFYSLESSRGLKRANMSHIVDTELEDLDEAQLEELYAWLDQIPLSRPLKTMARDFSDGVLVAEVVKHFLPHIVDTHNYPPATSTRQKMSNWYLLNRKVFQKMHFQLSDDVIRKVSMCTTGVVQKVLSTIKTKLTEALVRRQIKKGKRAPVPGGSSPIGSDKHEVNHNKAMLPQTSLPKAKPSPEVPSNAGSYNGSKAKGSMETDVVPRIMLEEKEQECLYKDKIIQTIIAKVVHLQNLIHQKDIRNDDFQDRIKQ